MTQESAHRAPAQAAELRDAEFDLETMVRLWRSLDMARVAVAAVQDGIAETVANIADTIDEPLETEELAEMVGAMLSHILMLAKAVEALLARAGDGQQWDEAIGVVRI